jgi:hypothetical protein
MSPLSYNFNVIDIERKEALQLIAGTLPGEMAPPDSAPFSQYGDPLSTYGGWDSGRHIALSEYSWTDSWPSALDHDSHLPPADLGPNILSNSTAISIEDGDSPHSDGDSSK